MPLVDVAAPCGRRNSASLQLCASNRLPSRTVTIGSANVLQLRCCISVKCINNIQISLLFREMENNKNATARAHTRAGTHTCSDIAKQLTTSAADRCPFNCTFSLVAFSGGGKRSALAELIISSSARRRDRIGYFNYGVFLHSENSLRRAAFRLEYRFQPNGTPLGQRTKESSKLFYYLWCRKSG